ncbi:MAG: hypothetical protein GX096_08070 [Clostridiales bacterium]|nr:hypothetical protein [Clostridiales bacterium]
MYTWYVPDGYVPADTDGRRPAMIGHEAIAILNDHQQEANLAVEVFYCDCEPMKPQRFVISPCRSCRIIIGAEYQLDGSLCIDVPANRPYSLKIMSDIPLHIQFTRVDTRDGNLALMSVMLHAE